MNPSCDKASRRIRLAFASCPDYSEQALRPALERVLTPQIEAVGGVSGKSVMLKPNLLAWRKDNDPQIGRAHV